MLWRIHPDVNNEQSGNMPRRGCMRDDSPALSLTEAASFTQRISYAHTFASPAEIDPCQQYHPDVTIEVIEGCDARPTLRPFPDRFSGSRALRLLPLLRPRGPCDICKSPLEPALVRWISWCAVCAVRCGTRVSSSRRGVPRYRGACAPSPPGITEVPPPRVHPARARSFDQELIFGSIVIKRELAKSPSDVSLRQVNHFLLSRRDFLFFQRSKVALQEKSPFI